MTTQINTLSPSIFIDVAGAHIPYSEPSLQINQHPCIKRALTPFSQIGTGKFRKIFNRHAIIYR